jgi:hypothetical protein
MVVLVEDPAKALVSSDVQVGDLVRISARARCPGPRRLIRRAGPSRPVHQASSSPGSTRTRSRPHAAQLAGRYEMTQFHPHAFTPLAVGGRPVRALAPALPEPPRGRASTAAPGLPGITQS